jgi:hypothetical protein
MHQVIIYVSKKSPSKIKSFHKKCKSFILHIKDILDDSHFLSLQGK